MVTQYPYYLYLKQIVSSKDSLGDIETNESFVFVSYCRNETKSSRVFYTEDSKEIESNSIVYLPLSTDFNLKSGDYVQIKEKSGFVRLQGQIQNVHIGQLNIKLWL